MERKEQPLFKKETLESAFSYVLSMHYGRKITVRLTEKTPEELERDGLSAAT